MTAPDHDAIRAALADSRLHYQGGTVVGWLAPVEVDALAPTVAALMEQYAESYAAERVRAALLDAAEAVERHREDAHSSVIVPGCDACNAYTYAASILRDRAGAS